MCIIEDSVQINTAPYEQKYYEGNVFLLDFDNAVQ